MTQQQNTLTALYTLSSQTLAKEFDVFRESRGLAPYFSERSESAHGGRGLIAHFHGNDYYLDHADLDEMDLAFLAGAQTKRIEGIRLVYPHTQASDHPAIQVIDKLFPIYTFWPNSHMLAPAQHALFTFMEEFLADYEIEEFIVH